MTNDIVCAENELSIAINSFDGYADFLCRKMDEYIEILDSIQRTGAIKDPLICPKLVDLGNKAGTYKTMLSTTTVSVAKKMRGYVEKIEAEDNFAFPDDFSVLISGIASQFKRG